MFELKASNQILTSVYNAISNGRTFSSRAEVGTCADLMEVGDGWLRKEDKPGVELAEREFSLLLSLQDTGIVPEVDEDEGAQGYPCGFYIRKINNGGTIGEYAMSFLAGEIPVDVFVSLMEAVGDLMCAFWKKGVVHGDLNLGNIVVGLSRPGLWRPFVIDLGYSFWESDGAPELDRTIIESISEDAEYLLTNLKELGDDPDYLECLESLEERITRYL